MTLSVSGFGNNNNYISPFGGNSLQQKTSMDTATQEIQQDTFIKKHKKKDNTAQIAGNVALVAATALGIYTGKGLLKSGFAGLQNGIQYISKNGFVASIVDGISNIGTKITNIFTKK